MMKEDAVSADETPKKRRTRAAAPEAEESAPAKPKARRKAKEPEAAPAVEPAAEPKKATRRKKADVEAAPAAEAPREEAPAKPAKAPKEPKEPKEPKPEARKAEAPKSEAPQAEAPKPAAPPVEARQEASRQEAPRQEAPRQEAPAPQGAESSGAPAAADGGAPQGQGESRRERHRHRHERRQQQQGQGGQQAAPAQGATQPQAREGGQQQPPQGQPGQPGQGGGRKRRRRRRGGGGGQPGQPGQQHAGVEAQYQPASGILEVDDRGNGRLRRTDRSFQAGDNDPEVPRQMIERYRLRPGAILQAQTLMRNGRQQVARVDQVDGVTPEEAQNRISFMNLTSVDPLRRIKLETTSNELLTRAIDIIAPIGFGQRALIVAPPKTGKTIILQKIARAVLQNHPNAKLMVLLIDERPEEVTDFKRSIGADVYASSSDRPAHEHLRIAELVMERARRLVEAGDDVVVLLDSITRLARAYNKEIESSGRTMSGGVDSRALERPKRLFGAARNTEEAGSLTIIGTALVDTGSRMDEVIFEEFKGTGNMEIMLDRQLAERRIWPAVNVNNSGTRKEEKLFSPKENEKIRKLRAYLAALRPVEAMEKLLGRLRDFRSNDEFYDAL